MWFGVRKGGSVGAARAPRSPLKSAPKPPCDDFDTMYKSQSRDARAGCFRASRALKEGLMWGRARFAALPGVAITYYLNIFQYVMIISVARLWLVSPLVGFSSPAAVIESQPSKLFWVASAPNHHHPPSKCRQGAPSCLSPMGNVKNHEWEIWVADVQEDRNLWGNNARHVKFQDPQPRFSGDCELLSFFYFILSLGLYFQSVSHTCANRQLMGHRAVRKGVTLDFGFFSNPKGVLSWKTISL